MLQPPVYDLGDKHLYRDGDTFYLSHQLMTDFINHRITRTAHIVSHRIAYMGKLESVNEIAKAVEKSPSAVRKAIEKLRKTGILDKLLDQGILNQSE